MSISGYCVCRTCHAASVGQSPSPHHSGSCSPGCRLCYADDCGEQGVAFLSRYRELRGDTAEGLDEVEYNFGRVFQQLGSSPNSLSVTVVCVFDEQLLLRSMQASIHSLSATTSGYCKPLKRGQRRTLRCVLSTSPPCLPHVVFRMSVWRVKPPIICLSST